LSKYGLDKFYTKNNIVDNILKKINVLIYDNVVEPSAGNGSFSSKIKDIHAYDISPDNDSIIKQDFLKLIPNFSGSVLVIGNPPFGKNSSLALSFIKHSCSFADTIAFILPKSFKKQSFYEKIPLNFWKTYEEDIPDNSFTYESETVNIPCVFQIYEKKEILREKTKIIVPDFFSFVSKDKAKLSIRRVGIYSGRADMNYGDKSTQSHYFIDTENPEKFVSISNSLVWEHNNTVGPRSISKKEFIDKIKSVWYN